MKKITLGILAHVDSGKTTLSEALLYNTGEIRTLGRVDHKNTHLDTNDMEKDRGITIFSHQAHFKLSDTEVTLLDTPGHVDFSAEAERTLSVLDYAVLLISAPEKVQSHTKTLWDLLNHYSVPTFIFINKLDLENEGKNAILSDIRESLTPLCADFSEFTDEFYEEVATNTDCLFDEYIKSGKISDSSLADAIKERRLFPCFFGSALKNDGVDKLAEALSTYTNEPLYSDIFGAKVFKITEDDKGQRLTHMKITGGSLKVKTVISEDNPTEKINELRLYSGAGYKAIPEAFAGQIVAATGITSLSSGSGLGFEEDSSALLSEPVFTYTAALPPSTDITYALSAFKKLESEETKLSVNFNEDTRKINVSVMGKIQLEILKRQLSERFSIDVDFESCSIYYKETVKNTVEGVGHFEPLRHYAEVHLLIEPGKRGSGLVFGTKVGEDILSRNWQRLILTHLAEKTHRGVLTGAPLTDVKITLVNGKAHLKHTEGGDFRQATYRAVRQGLMQAESALLEPYYEFTLKIPTASTGRAMTDLDRIGATFTPPEMFDTFSVIKGRAPVSVLSEYPDTVTAYTHGLGSISFSFGGYDECLNAQEVIAKKGYDAESDLRNSPDSVFCSGGSGFTVKWDEVFSHMHLPLLSDKKEVLTPLSAPRREKKEYSDSELLEIFERTYGKIKRPKERREEERVYDYTKSEKPQKAKPYKNLPTYLLIDGYNVIYSWSELKAVSSDSFDAARQLLADKICNYNAMEDINIILVFDAYKVKGKHREIEDYNGIKIVYTKEAETADSYIEKTSKELSKDYRVKVATSDNLEQVIIFGHGAVRITADELKKDIEYAENAMRRIISEASDGRATSTIDI